MKQHRNSATYVDYANGTLNQYVAAKKCSTWDEFWTSPSKVSYVAKLLSKSEGSYSRLGRSGFLGLSEEDRLEALASKLHKHGVSVPALRHSHSGRLN